MSIFSLGFSKEILLRDFFKNPEKTGYQISKDGKYLSYLASYESRLNVFVQEIGTEKVTRITSETERDIAGYFWANNETILYVKDFKGDENFHIVSANIDGSAQRDLTPFEKVRAGILDELDYSDTDILITMNKRNPEIFDVYRLNYVTGDLKMVAENPGNISNWVTDHDGNIKVAVTTDGVNTSMLYRENESSPFKTVITTSFKDNLSPLFFTFDNKYLYASSNIGRDKSVIVKIDPQTANELQVIYQHPEVDISGLNFSKKRKVLTEINYITWKAQTEYLDAETKKLHERIESELGKNLEIVITSENKDEDKFLIRTYSDKSLGSYYFYDSKADKMMKLVDVSPWLNESDMCDMKPVSYTSRDGLKINGYLTLPKGKEAKNLPVVVNPHGGPWARDVWRWNPEIQFLANRGYAVLQINFRGSTGYGKSFWQSSFKQWGKTMQNDITDGVDWLIKQGIADSKKIAIYGGSYGGYATLAGVTFTPDVYACAVDYVGVSNLFSFMKTIPPYWKQYLEMMYEMVGHPEKDSIALTESSPVFHVDKIKCPLFVAQGKMDPRVNINESDQIVNALKSRGVDVQYMVKDNEGHGFRNEENRFDFYGAMEKFLAQHLLK